MNKSSQCDQYRRYQEIDTSFLDFLEEGIANAFDAEYEKEREYRLIKEYAVEEKTNEIAKKMLKYMTSSRFL